MDFTSLITPAQQAFSIAKKLKNTELQAKLLDIQTEANKWQAEVNQLHTDVSVLTKKNQELENVLTNREELVKKGDAYWRKDNTPVCSHCWEAKRVMISLASTHYSNAYLFCPMCDQDFCIYPEKEDFFVATSFTVTENHHRAVPRVKKR